MLVNNDWKFMHGDFPEAAFPDYDDGEWYDIGLPHSFGIPYFMEHEFYVGYGCYRKWIMVEEAWLQKKVYLEFQGVFQETEVYVNGELAGSHQGGYTAFAIDLTAFIRAGENLIFVRVNNLWNAKIAPRGGEHVFNGGIYRDVSLLIVDPVHIAWYGTFIMTPEVSSEKAKLKIQTELCNDTGEAVRCRLQSDIYFGLEKIAEYSTEGMLLPEEEKVFEQNGEILDPKLWHPDTPFLYTMKSTLWVEEKKVDECETSFGIRWFSFTAEEGFFLNGEHYDIHGANVHQDHAGWSDAVTHAGIRRDIALVKECGLNFIRGSHYPHHTYFAEECDRQGLLFWSENCFWGTGGARQEGYWTASAYPIREEDEKAFEESCFQTLTEMIRTNRNHPSIIVWSMCNEPFFSDAEVMHKAKALLRKLVELSHKLDPGRPAALGGVQRGGFDAIGDLAGYNGDGASIFINPGFPNFVSEYGSVVEDRPGQYGHRYRDGVETNPAWRSGKAMWCAFHHGSILGDMGHMGMIDYYRLPLNSWYWYRKQLLGIDCPEKVEEGIPYRICLQADKREIKGDGTEDVQIIVFVEDADGKRVSNAPDVVLEVVRGEGIFPTGKRFVFSGEKGNFAEGLGAIELHSWHQGEICVRATAIVAVEDTAQDSAFSSTKGRDEMLESAEVVIRVVSGSLAVGRQLKELMPPPYVCGEPEREKLFDIAIDRPVFYSSADLGHPGKNLTDGTWETWWYPAKEEAGEWIQVDLEGTKEVKKLGVSFNNVVNDGFEIGFSDNGKDYRNIYVSEKGNADSFLNINLYQEKTRYVRVRFSGKPVGVNKLELWT